MATREKKLSVGRKQNASSPIPPKEDVTSPESAKEDPSEDGPALVKNPAARAAKGASLAKKLAPKSSPTKLNKKPTITIRLKPKNPKAKQKKIKAILNNPKIAETKKKLLKTCAKTPKQKKVKKETKIDKTDESLPPVLEPIFPIEENVDSKAKKKARRPPKIDNYAKKDKADSSENFVLNQSKTKRVYKRKLKEVPPTETIEDVMNDLTSLIKGGDSKEESDVPSESGRSDPKLEPKPKKVAKRKLKENIENTLSKLSVAERKVIDMLDLNVEKIGKGLPATKRRHSIEKFPIGNLDGDAGISQLSIFNSLPRCISPRSKNLPKLRQTVDGFSRRSNPYKTRSDSPARILRNGKHRKLKDSGLFEGLDGTSKRRKRNCSEFSGSEMSGSKLSGYESDSSFSDMSSLHGAETAESKDIESIKAESKDAYEMGEELPAMSDNLEALTAVIKRSISTDGDNVIDTNSNLCDNSDKRVNGTERVAIKTERSPSTCIAVSPSLKVPEKSIILDIMKQAFNDTFPEREEKEKTSKQPERQKLGTVPTALFYGNGSAPSHEMKEEINQINESQTNGSADHERSDNVEDLLDDSIEDVAIAEKRAVENSVVESPPEEQPGKVDGINEIAQLDREIQQGVEIPGEAIEESVNVSELSREFVENGETVPNQVDGKIEETPENLAIKENILQALGLQSLKAAKEAKLKRKEKSEVKDSYTGTLKTVIKLNRDKKKGRNSMKMTLHKNKGKSSEYGIDAGADGPSSSWKHGGQSSDTGGAHRKSHYSNRSNMDGSSEHTSDGEAGSQEGPTKALVIPEKASSFSIHPGRLCKDECTYCFGKFGLFDTPCHIAQMKSVEKQNKILLAEKHLTRDSCLCDACYRHVDRKLNTPSCSNKPHYRRGAMVGPGPRQDHCHVLGCSKIASNILRRKWIIKMRRSICEVINIDLDNPGLHSIPICDEHYSMLEHLMICAMCKRRLAKNHIHYLGPETAELNSALNSEGIPLTLADKPVVCKLCKYFAAVILKAPDDRPENSSNFFMEYKKRLLHFNDIVPMDEAAAEEPITFPSKEKALEKEQSKKKKKPTKVQPVESCYDFQLDSEKSDQSRVPSSDSTNQSRPESPSDYMVDYNTLIPSIAMECGSDSESRKEPPAKPVKKISRPECVKQAVEISKNMKLKHDKNSDIAVQRLGSNPSISVRQLFPCEEELQLQCNFDFANVKERTPEGWEKCTSVIQYDMETKHLWHELQKPYGNQSSFLRHLMLLEKYFRNGDLVLSPNASHYSVNYSESVQNRLRSYDNIGSNTNFHPLTLISLGNTRPQKSNSGIITSANSIKDSQPPAVPMVNAANIPKNTPLTISQLNSPPLIPPAVPPKPKPVGAPPGLISLHPGTNRPVAPLVKPQSQKFKFPITKNWRPTLIPLDPNNKSPEKKAGLVQVISGGKPYHITLEDYKKMCAIKKSFELKQKRLQDASKPMKMATNSVLKAIGPRKSLIISKTSTRNDASESENILEKLDKQVEKLEAKLNDKTSILTLPKIPKSLTVIPQTVTRKILRPSSPVLLITQKPKQIPNKS